MITLPAGKYYVGDPCYHIDDSKWSDYCDQVVFAQDKKTVFNGKNTCCFNTAYGDGCYQDQFGNNYGVDAGLIGVVELDSDYPLSLIDKDYSQYFEFNEPFTCYSNVEGCLTFGHIVIETGDSVEEYDENE